MNSIPKDFTPLTMEEFQNMSDEQKRTAILQVQQFETFKWVKQASMVFVYGFSISLLLTILIAANTFIR
jgi:hypothetical protein